MRGVGPGHRRRRTAGPESSDASVCSRGSSGGALGWVAIVATTVAVVRVRFVWIVIVVDRTCCGCERAPGRYCRTSLLIRTTFLASGGSFSATTRSPTALHWGSCWGLLSRRYDVSLNAERSDLPADAGSCCPRLFKKKTKKFSRFSVTLNLAAHT